MARNSRRLAGLEATLDAQAPTLTDAERAAGIMALLAQDAPHNAERKTRVLELLDTARRRKDEQDER